MANTGNRDCMGDLLFAGLESGRHCGRLGCAACLATEKAAAASLARNPRATKFESTIVVCVSCLSFFNFRAFFSAKSTQVVGRSKKCLSVCRDVSANLSRISENLTTSGFEGYGD